MDMNLKVSYLKEWISKFHITPVSFKNVFFFIIYNNSVKRKDNNSSWKVHNSTDQIEHQILVLLVLLLNLSSLIWVLRQNVHF